MTHRQLTIITEKKLNKWPPNNFYPTSPMKEIYSERVKMKHKGEYNKWNMKKCKENNLYSLIPHLMSQRETHFSDLIGLITRENKTHRRL